MLSDLRTVEKQLRKLNNAGSSKEFPSYKHHDVQNDKVHGSEVSTGQKQGMVPNEIYVTQKRIAQLEQKMQATTRGKKCRDQVDLIFFIFNINSKTHYDMVKLKKR